MIRPNRRIIVTVNMRLNRNAYDNIILVNGMVHKTHVCVTRPMVRHYGRISYEESFGRLSAINIVQVK